LVRVDVANEEGFGPVNPLSGSLDLSGYAPAKRYRYFIFAKGARKVASAMI
jgi:hypothetical protein